MFNISDVTRSLCVIKYDYDTIITKNRDYRYDFDFSSNATTISTSVKRRRRRTAPPCANRPAPVQWTGMARGMRTCKAITCSGRPADNEITSQWHGRLPGGWAWPSQKGASLTRCSDAWSLFLGATMRPQRRVVSKRLPLFRCCQPACLLLSK